MSEDGRCKREDVRGRLASIARILLSMPVCIESDKIYSHRVCGLDLAYSISGASLWDFLLKYLESIVFFLSLQQI